MTARLTTMICGLCLIFSSCGSLKVGLDDETITAAECLLKDVCDDDTEQADSGDDGNDSSDPAEEEESGIEGGIGFASGAQKGSNRLFVGTFVLDDFVSSCTATYYYWDPFDLPDTVRVFSYSNKIDFENSRGDLVWVADLYPDGTFDFIVQYLNALGRPSATLDCTCTLSQPYGYYSQEVITCDCDPSNQSMACDLTYNLL